MSADSSPDRSRPAHPGPSRSAARTRRVRSSPMIRTDAPAIAPPCRAVQTARTTTRATATPRSGSTRPNWSPANTREKAMARVMPAPTRAALIASPSSAPPSIARHSPRARAISRLSKARALRRSGRAATGRSLIAILCSRVRKVPSSAGIDSGRSEAMYRARRPFVFRRPVYDPARLTSRRQVPGDGELRVSAATAAGPRGHDLPVTADGNEVRVVHVGAEVGEDVASRPERGVRRAIAQVPRDGEPRIRAPQPDSTRGDDVAAGDGHSAREVLVGSVVVRQLAVSAAGGVQGSGARHSEDGGLGVRAEGSRFSHTDDGRAVHRNPRQVVEVRAEVRAELPDPA